MEAFFLIFGVLFWIGGFYDIFLTVGHNSIEGLLSFICGSVLILGAWICSRLKNLQEIGVEILDAKKGESVTSSTPTKT
jgi:hypothetical protein